ncbi:MAG: hypothetical protein HC894_28985 [Microcoleus sp. SM1_3_4]|nr:hypothetical protein [Microcoleus sp. SM1_3_4]
MPKIRSPPAAASHAIIARAAFEVVVAFAAGEGIFADLTENSIGPFASFQAVVARFTPENVISRLSQQRIVVVAAPKFVIVGIAF